MLRRVIAIAAIAATASLAACSSTSPEGSSGAVSAVHADSTVVAAAKAALPALLKGNEDAPPTSGPPVAPNKDVWLISCGQTTTCATIVDGATAAAKVLGWQLHVCDGKLDADNAYVTCTQQAIAAKADGIIEVSIDCALIKQPLLAAKAANIPVIAAPGYDCADNLPEPAGSNLFTASLIQNKDFPTFKDYTTYAQNAYATYLIAQTNGKANIIDMDYTGGTLGVVAENALQAAIGKCAGCRITKVPFDLQQFTPDSLKSLFQAAYLKDQDANAVTACLATEYELGLGAAVKAVGKNILSAAGTGSEVSAMDLVRTGGLSVIAAADETWNGWGAMDTMNRVFDRQPAVPEGIGIKLVTKDTVGGSGAYTSDVDYVAGYRKLWQR